MPASQTSFASIESDKVKTNPLLARKKLSQLKMSKHLAFYVKTDDFVYRNLESEYRQKLCKIQEERLAQIENLDSFIDSFCVQEQNNSNLGKMVYDLELELLDIKTQIKTKKEMARQSRLEMVKLKNNIRKVKKDLKTRKDIDQLEQDIFGNDIVQEAIDLYNDKKQVLKASTELRKMMMT